MECLFDFTCLTTRMKRQRSFKRLYVFACKTEGVVDDILGSYKRNAKDKMACFTAVDTPRTSVPSFPPRFLTLTADEKKCQCSIEVEQDLHRHRPFSVNHPHKQK